MDNASPSPPASGIAGQSPPPLPPPPPPPPRRGRSRFLWMLLLLSAALNLVLIMALSGMSDSETRIRERFFAGSRTAADKIAIIELEGMLMPPYTDRWLKAIEQAEKDTHVRGVLVSIDSPGGLVADSHRVYHALSKLREKKPVFVAMGRTAASGGLYAAMGAGPDGLIFAEPTTWTGSIGVIIPRYEVTELAQKLGIKADALKTGPLKDSPSPFRPMTEEERKVWTAIMEEAFDRFLRVIADNRKELKYEFIRKELATGQVFTAKQALQHKLIDRIGFRDEALDALQERLGLNQVRIVRYVAPTTLLDVLMGNVSAGLTRSSAAAPRPMAAAYYLFDADAVFFNGFLDRVRDRL